MQNLDIHQVDGWTSHYSCSGYIMSNDPMITVIGIIQPLLLIIDGAHVHLSTWISEFCHEKNLVLCLSQFNTFNTTIGLSINGFSEVPLQRASAKMDCGTSIQHI